MLRAAPSMPAGRSLLTCLLLLVGCKDSPAQQPAPAPTPGPERAQVAAVEPADDQQPRTSAAASESSLPAQSPAQLQATRRRIETLLDEARMLARRSKLAASAAKYYELLAIAPHYRTALSELAWAEFRIGRMRSAWAHTLRALADSADSDERAQLLYYLGRIAVLRKQPEPAALLYQRSLALRESKTVSTHLARLPLAPEQRPTLPESAPDMLAGLRVIGEGLADGEAVCTLLRRGQLCDIESCSFGSQLEGTDASWDMLVVEDQYGLGRCYHPVVQTEAGWTLFAAALHESSGQEVQRSVELLGARAELPEGAAEALVFEWSIREHARDWNSTFAESQTPEQLPADIAELRRGLVLCQRHEGRARCTHALTLEREGWRDDQRVHHELTLEIGAQGLSLSQVEREGPRPLELSTGSHGWPPLEPQI